MLDDDERMSAAVIAKSKGTKRYEVGGPFSHPRRIKLDLGNISCIDY